LTLGVKSLNELKTFCCAVLSLQHTGNSDLCFAA